MIETNNYYPKQREGLIADIEAGTPIYGTDLDAARAVQALAEAVPERPLEFRF